MSGKQVRDLRTLNIITPFKDDNLNFIRQTIKNLSENKTYVTIYHYIVYDESCKNLINKLIKESKFKQDNYFYRCIQANSVGIYPAINEGLNFVPLNSYYMVVGAGDIFLKMVSPIKTSKNNIILFPYKLSISNDEKYLRNIRSIYGGMPFCHNAIAFINDGSKYSERFKISADYDYFIKYIKRHKLNIKLLRQSIQESIVVEFESKFGLSSKSRISKNFENVIIFYRNFGFLKIFLYFWHTSKRIINIFWKMI